MDGKLAYLTREVDTSFKEMEFLKQEVDELELKLKDDSLETLQRQADEVEKQWEALMERTKGWESDGLLGDLCLIAMYVERALCAYTFPEVFKKDDDIGSLRDLLNFLNNDDQLVSLDPSKYNCEKVLEEAKERWAVVCKNFNFSDEWKTKTGVWEVSDCSVPHDIRAIEVLKARLGGFSVIEKPISLQYAEQNIESMKYELSLGQFDLVAGFIGSLREKMIKTGFSHGNLLLD